jgi:uncharacterized protein (DUF2236 family)
MTLSSHQNPVRSGPSSPQPLGPDSLAWQLGLPRTALLLAGRALVLQVAHPVIGAGVRDFSNYRDDPWSRLDRTLGSLQVQLFGGERAREESRRLRRLHGAIRGTGFDGEPYRAHDPAAYAWVHLSNFDSLLAFHRWFAPPLRAGEPARLYAEWRQSGRVLGIADDCMPADLDGFRAYVRHMITDTLTGNPTTRELLESLRLDQIGPPPWPLFPPPLWRALRPVGRALLHDATVGTLPAGLRQKLGLSWTAADRHRLRALAVVVRAASIPVPDRLMHYPLAQQARREARRHGLLAVAS